MLLEDFEKNHRHVCFVVAFSETGFRVETDDRVRGFRRWVAGVGTFDDAVFVDGAVKFSRERGEGGGWVFWKLDGGGGGGLFGGGRLVTMLVVVVVIMIVVVLVLIFMVVVEFMFTFLPMLVFLFTFMFMLVLTKQL